MSLTRMILTALATKLNIFLAHLIRIFSLITAVGENAYISTVIEI